MECRGETSARPILSPVPGDLYRSMGEPVCSPRLLQAGHGLRRPEDVMHYTRIHSTTDLDDWRKWLAAANVISDDAHRGPRLASFVRAIQAALSGFGIAMIRRLLVMDDLPDVPLVAPVQLCLSNPNTWQ